MTNPPRSRVRILVVAMMLVAIGCVGLLASPRPGTRITILHDYWSQARVDSSATLASLDAARKEAQMAVPSGQYLTTDRINLGDRSLKSRFELMLSEAGTFTAARVTSIGRDKDDRVAVTGRYRVVGRALEFVPLEGPVGLYPVNGTSLITLPGRRHAGAHGRRQLHRAATGRLALNDAAGRRLPVAGRCEDVIWRTAA